MNGADYQLRYLHDGFPGVLGPMTSNRMKITRLLPRGRILFVSFFSSVSRFYDYTLSVGDFADLAGNPLETDNGELTTREVHPDFVTPPGGIVQGFVRRGAGTPIALARVTLSEFFEDYITALPIEVTTGITSTDASGFYRVDDRVQDCGRRAAPGALVTVALVTGVRA